MYNKGGEDEPVMSAAERLAAIKYWERLIRASVDSDSLRQVIIQLSAALSLWANEFTATDQEKWAIYDIVEALKPAFPIH